MYKNITVALAFGTMAFAAGPAHAEEIAIAVVGPMTGSNAALGDQEKRGAEQAVKDINARGGVLGKTLTLTVADDACDPKQGVAVANQMVSKGVVFVAGHMCSGATIPASAVYHEAGILMITPAATNPMLTEKAAEEGWNNVYRTCGRDDAQGAVAGRFMATTYKGKSVAILDDKSAYGKGVADETRKSMNAAGLKEAVDEQITAGDQDFSAVIAKLKQANVHAVYFGGYPVEAGLLVRQAHDQGLGATFVTPDSMATPDFYAVTGAAGDGTIMTFAPDPRLNAAAKEAVGEFQKSGFDPEGYTLDTYAAVQIFAEAAAQAKSFNVDDRAKVMHRTTFNTVVGPIKYDAKGDIVNPQYVIYVWKAGKYEQMM